MILPKRPSSASLQQPSQLGASASSRSISEVCRLCLKAGGGAMRIGEERLWVHSCCVLYAVGGPFFKQQLHLDSPTAIASSVSLAAAMQWGEFLPRLPLQSLAAARQRLQEQQCHQAAATRHQAQRALRVAGKGPDSTPNAADLLLPAAEDLDALQELLELHAQVLKERQEKRKGMKQGGVEGRDVENAAHKLPITALIDFGSVAAWCCFEPVEGRYSEAPQAAQLLDELCSKGRNALPSASGSNGNGSFVLDDVAIKAYLQKVVAPALAEHQGGLASPAAFGTGAAGASASAATAAATPALPQGGGVVVEEGATETAQKGQMEQNMEEWRKAMEPLRSSAPSTKARPANQQQQMMKHRLAGNSSHTSGGVNGGVASLVEVAGHRWYWGACGENREAGDFVGSQCMQFLQVGRVLARDLHRFKSSLLRCLLEENQSTLRLSERADVLSSLLQRYGEMQRLRAQAAATAVACARRMKRRQLSRPWLVGEISSLNPLYSCVRCLLCCHKHCYGVGRMGEAVEAEDWLCRRCEFEKRTLGTQWMAVFKPMDPKCQVTTLTSAPSKTFTPQPLDSHPPAVLQATILVAICCRGGGALKPTATGAWAHVLCCVFLMPEVVCLDLQRLEPWSLEGVQSWRRFAVCSLCGVAGGACLRCSQVGCTVAFHPMCAWLGGLYCSAETIPGLFLVVRGTLDHCFPRLRLNAFCFKHTPEAPSIRRSGALQAVMRSRRYCTRDHCPELHALSERKGAFFLKPTPVTPAAAAPPAAATRRSVAAAAAAAASAHSMGGGTPAAETAPGAAASGGPWPNSVTTTGSSGCITPNAAGEGLATAAGAAAGGRAGETSAAAATTNGDVFATERPMLEELDFYQDHCCAVCLLPKVTASTNNPFFYCSRCGISVHRMCYGIPRECLPSILRPELQPQEQLEAEDCCSNGGEPYVPVPFLCEPCRYASNRDEVYCQLCPRRGGALKLALPSSCGFTVETVVGASADKIAAAVAAAVSSRRVDGGNTAAPLQFVHMVCALWTPGVEAAETESLSPIVGVDAALQRELQQNPCNSAGLQLQEAAGSEGTGESAGTFVCAICGLSFGLMLSCCARECTTTFHALCAQLRGCFMEMAETTGPSFQATAFCLKHSHTRNQISPSVRLLLRLRSFLELVGGEDDFGVPEGLFVDDAADDEAVKSNYMSLFFSGPVPPSDFTASSSVGSRENPAEQPSEGAELLPLLRISQATMASDGRQPSHCPQVCSCWRSAPTAGGGSAAGGAEADPDGSALAACNVEIRSYFVSAAVLMALQQLRLFFVRQQRQHEQQQRGLDRAAGGVSSTERESDASHRMKASAAVPQTAWPLDDDSSYVTELSGLQPLLSPLQRGAANEALLYSLHAEAKNCRYSCWCSFVAALVQQTPRDSQGIAAQDGINSMSAAAGPTANGANSLLHQEEAPSTAAVLQRMLHSSSAGWTGVAAVERVTPPLEWRGTLRTGVAAIGRRVALYSPYMGVWYGGVIVFCDNPSGSSSGSDSSSSRGFRAGRCLIAYDDGDCAWAYLEGLADVLLFSMSTENHQLWMEALKRRRQRKIQQAVAAHLREKQQTGKTAAPFAAAGASLLLPLQLGRYGAACAAIGPCEPFALPVVAAAISG
ncbi:phd finger protein br140 lin-related protein [Cyclospora cayetanensis]|uniref:Phd finger protein br140 lin-related protein n=1 Tax=Cyclospora cayetanensis TaxID=88456 RepID=A0A1D3CZB8_9EIME|nr:phd finger protein br140 lin-related protein [Cyclospora cayetanensis]